MKLEWQAEDIIPGRIVGKPDRLERWMIGYVVSGSENMYCLVSMADGMVQPPQDKADLAELLNNAGEIPIEYFSDPSHIKRGQKGGAARAASLSAARRSEIASTAAIARWKKGDPTTGAT
jgi:hypothetical protein